MSDNRYCPDHPDTALHEPEQGEVLRCLTCPKCPAGLVTGVCTNRRCTVCLGPDASWMSGTCDSCYRRSERDRVEEQERSRTNRIERRVLEDLRQSILEDGRNALRALDEWIEARS